MADFFSFGGQIDIVITIRFNEERNPFNNLQTVTLQPWDFARIVGNKANVFNP